MPRRASSGANVGQIAGIAAAIIGVLLIAALLFRLIAGDMLGGLERATLQARAQRMQLRST